MYRNIIIKEIQKIFEYIYNIQIFSVFFFNYISMTIDYNLNRYTKYSISLVSSQKQPPSTSMLITI